MSRSLRGLTRGFQEGLKIGGTLRGIRRDQDLANESERYGVTEGAYGQGLGENVQQVQGLQQQALEQARYQGASEEDLARIESQYAPSIAELTRRQSLTAPDFTIASRSMRPEDTFATREAAEMAAKPMRTQGLAGVYRQYGEIEKADELLARADQQKLAGLQTRAAEMTVKERERAIEAQQKLDSFEAWRAENPNVTGSQLKDVARSQFKLNDDQLLKVTSTITGLAENDIKQFQLEMKNAIKGKDLNGLTEMFNTDDRLDPNTDLKVVRGKNGAVTLNFVDKQGNPLSSQNFSSEALATTFLNKQATEPDQVAEWLLGVQKTQAQIAASEAGAFKDRQVGLAAGAEKAPRPVTIAELNTMAKGMIDSGMEDPDAPGTPLKYTTALAMARAEAAGVPYVSEADRATAAAIAARQEEERKKKAGGGATTTTTTTTPGLTRAQVGQAVTQQQTGVQAETRVRRAAITEFEQSPQVRQAYDAVRQLRRSGEAVRANNIENQINAQRERFIAERVGGGR